MAVFLCPGCLPSNPPSWLRVKSPCPVAQYPPFGAGNCIPSLAPLVPLHWHSRHSPVGPSSLATLLAPLSLSNHHKRKSHRPPSLPLLLTLSFLRPYFLPLLVSLLAPLLSPFFPPSTFLLSLFPLTLFLAYTPPSLPYPALSPEPNTLVWRGLCKTLIHGNDGEETGS